MKRVTVGVASAVDNLRNALASGNEVARSVAVGRLTSELAAWARELKSDRVVSPSASRGDAEKVEIKARECLELLSGATDSATSSAPPWDGTIIRVVLEVLLEFLGRFRKPAPTAITSKK